jgi:hypothetical protein
VQLNFWQQIASDPGAVFLRHSESILISPLLGCCLLLLRSQTICLSSLLCCCLLLLRSRSIWISSLLGCCLLLLRSESIWISSLLGCCLLLPRWFRPPDAPPGPLPPPKCRPRDNLRELLPPSTPRLQGVPYELPSTRLHRPHRNIPEQARVQLQLRPHGHIPEQARVQLAGTATVDQLLTPLDRGCHASQAFIARWATSSASGRAQQANR